MARGLLDLALLCQARKLRPEARRYLEEAHQLAEPHSERLAGKVRQALASLDQ